jgi:hypothetical protein
LLGIASTAFSGLNSMGLVSIFYVLNFLNSPNLEGWVPVFIFLRDRVAKLSTHAMMEELLEAAFSMLFALRLYKQSNYCGIN